MIKLGLNEPDGDGKGSAPKKQTERFLVLIHEEADFVKVVVQFYRAHRIQSLTSIEARQLADEIIKAANLIERRAALDWELALRHFRDIREQYTKLIGVPGTNSQLALQMVFRPLMTRFLNGERSPELYAEMMAVE